MTSPDLALKERFSYDILSKENREFRLVQFTGSTSPTEVGLTLHRISLNDSPAYHALSHIWGDPTPTRSVFVNGEPLPIAHNLHQVLLDLHRGGHGQEWFWVDAICINQNDPDERSWQVAQMGHIFGRAALVHIWLGPSSNDSDVVMQMAQRIGPDAHSAGVANLWLGWPSFRYSAKKPQEDAESVERRESFLARALSDEGLRSRRLLDAIKALLNRPSWYRTWIVQEIALARNGLVLCGAESVSLDFFDAAISTIFFCKNGDFARKHPRWNDFGAGLNNNLLRPRGLIARRQRGWGQKPSLLEFLLSDFMGAPDRPFYKASDPRDIIFGLFGVAADVGRLGLRPDYTQTTAEVYTAATRAMVERCFHYSLDYCAFPKEIDDLPTWVPDWQRVGRLGISSSGQPMSYRDLFNSSAGLAQPPPSKLLPTPVEGIPAWRVLRQRGCSVDVVTTAFASGQYGSDTEPALPLAGALDWPGEQRTRVLQAILSFAFAAHPYHDPVELETVLWRTLVADSPTMERCNSDYDALAARIFRQQPVPVGTLTKDEVGFLLRNTYPFSRRPNPEVATQA